MGGGGRGKAASSAGKLLYAPALCEADAPRHDMHPPLAIGRSSTRRRKTLTLIPTVPFPLPTLRSVAICAARPTAGHFATSGRCLLSDMNSLAGECRRSAHTKAQRLAIARDVGDQRNARPGCGKERSQPSDGRDWSAKRGSRPLHLAPNPVIH